MMKILIVFELILRFTEECMSGLVILSPTLP